MVYNNIKFEWFISLKISVKSGDAVDGFFGKGQKSKLISGRQLVNGQRQKRCFRHSPRDKKWTRGRLSEADQASSFLVAADGIVNQRRQPLFDRERVAAPKLKKQNPRPCSQLLSSRTDQRHVQLVYRVHVSTYSAANEAKVATLVATGRWFTSCLDSLNCELGNEKFTARSRPSSAYLVQISSISDDWLNWYGIWMENVDRAPVVAQITAETDLAEAACGSFLFGWRTVAPKLISDGVTRGLDGSRPCGTFISLRSHWSLFVHWSTRSSKRRIDDLFQSKS